MMQRLFILLLATTWGISLWSCSSSQTKIDEITGEEVATEADAGTDVIPEGDDTEPPPPTEQADATPPPPAKNSNSTEHANNEPAPSEQPPQATPAEPAPVNQEAQAAPPQTPEAVETAEYSVRVGDTLMKIAFETYGDLYKWKAIYEVNKDKIKDPNLLDAGLILSLEKSVVAVTLERNGEKYLIQRGDTLGSISNTIYGTPSRWKALWENNKQLIRDPNKIFAGFYLYYIKDNAPAPLADAGQAGEDSERNPGAAASVQN